MWAETNTGRFQGQGAAHSTFGKACTPLFLQSPREESHGGALPKLQMWDVHPGPHCPGAQSEESLSIASCF